MLGSRDELYNSPLSPHAHVHLEWRTVFPSGKYMLCLLVDDTVEKISGNYVAMRLDMLFM